ncbi:D-hexose-6-phosphate mutarotase [Thiomicrorhabdus arctica]|jgi:glucose-6-phosphate 1-epimerase|uniref:D-hexose-6-phosphate mutarotase n=1 Tax=Thiomicrorhabdus arctica TaxID=131540 RepID=UPI000379C9AA|nr:D-hexose-6-phosphate mutarotase [Thiomicrorhabdus arctica]
MPSRYSQQFSAEGVRFSMRENIMMIDVENAFASAQITTHGGCVLSFTPKNGQDLLWVSPTALYNGQKPVRGGIPICWPWFGAHSQETSAPAHGFVRNAVWHLDHIANLDSGVTEIVLTFDSNADTLAIWPHSFHLALRIEVGEKLAMSLITTNLSNHDIQITEAFHTYFNVADARNLVITGLEGSTHLDKLSHAPAERQVKTLTLNPPMDSVYLHQTSDVSIEDVGHQRNITIEKQHADSAVVWNPGPETVKGFADVPDDVWPEFVCVEAGNVFDNEVMIASGDKHTMTMLLSSQRS